MFGLDPENVIDRIRVAGQPVLLPNLRQSLFVGMIGFAIVAVLAFGLWAIAGRWLTQQFGEIGFYAILAVVLMAGGGAAFKPILIGPSLARFYGLFISSFLIYAIIWTVCYLGARELGHAKAGEWVGSIVGPAIMGVMFALSFRASGQMARCAVVLVLCHTAGYFSGDLLFALDALHNRYGMVLWGLTYGAGLGAGISLALFWCQTRVRESLQSGARESSADTPPEAET